MAIQYLSHTKIVIIAFHVILKVAIFHSQNLIFKTGSAVVMRKFNWSTVILQKTYYSSALFVNLSPCVSVGPQPKTLPGAGLLT